MVCVLIQVFLLPQGEVGVSLIVAPQKECLWKR